MDLSISERLEHLRRFGVEGHFRLGTEERRALIAEAQRLEAANRDLAAALEAALDGSEHHPACRDKTGHSCTCFRATVRAAIATLKGAR